MADFYLRDANGILKGRFMGNHATNIMRDIVGTWDTIKYKGEDRRACYRVEQDCAYTTENRFAHMTVYINAGDVILPML